MIFFFEKFDVEKMLVSDFKLKILVLNLQDLCEKIFSVSFNDFEALFDE